ncbi:MAG TPA: TolC family protein [Deltaproteobacteria bacterium]|nr:TolC family protein [Deltaproteobacteria bacterium]HOI06305.1 TolC family protein [Deltaproteobacteria bacterium]
MIRRVILFVIGIFFAAGLAAHAADYLTLDEAIAIALKNNPVVKAEEQNVQGRRFEERVSFANLLPKVDLNYSYQHQNTTPTMTIPMNTIVGGQPAVVPFDVSTGFQDTYSFQVTATQPLYMGGALYNAYKIAGNTYRASTLNRDQTLRDLKRQVIDGYYRLIQARQTLEVARSSMASIKAHLDVANAFYGQGMIPKNDLLEAEVSYAQSQQTVIQADNSAKVAESGLNRLLGRDLSVPIQTDREIPMQELGTTLDEAIGTALKNRQEIRVTELQIDSASKGITIARAGYLPNLAASASFTKYGEEPDIDYDETWTAGLGLSWNVFQGGASRYSVSRAIADRDQLTFLLQSQKDQVALEVKNDYLSAVEANARIGVASKAIAQAEENLRIQKDRFNLQVATTTDILDAQALLNRAQMNYILARSDYARSLAALRADMGEL